MKFCFAKLQIIIQKSKFENNKFKIIKFKMKDKRAKASNKYNNPRRRRTCSGELVVGDVKKLNAICNIAILRQFAVLSFVLAFGNTLHQAIVLQAFQTAADTARTVVAVGIHHVFA